MTAQGDPPTVFRRAVDREKNELLGAIQRLPAESEQGRAVRLALRELDARRRTLTENAP